MKVPANVFDGLPRAIQQHPYLRFGLLQFVVGHAEERPVEKQFVVVANQPLVRACKTPRTRKFPDGQVASSITLAYRFLDDLPLAKEASEIGVRVNSTGHTVAIPHDGNVVLGLR